MSFEYEIIHRIDKKKNCPKSPQKYFLDRLNNNEEENISSYKQDIPMNNEPVKNGYKGVFPGAQYDDSSEPTKMDAIVSLLLTEVVPKMVVWMTIYLLFNIILSFYPVSIPLSGFYAQLGVFFSIALGIYISKADSKTIASQTYLRTVTNCIGSFTSIFVASMKVYLANGNQKKDIDENYLKRFHMLLKSLIYSYKYSLRKEDISIDKLPIDDDLKKELKTKIKESQDGLGYRTTVNENEIDESITLKLTGDMIRTEIAKLKGEKMITESDALNLEVQQAGWDSAMGGAENYKIIETPVIIGFIQTIMVWITLIIMIYIFMIMFQPIIPVFTTLPLFAQNFVQNMGGFVFYGIFVIVLLSISSATKPAINPLNFEDDSPFSQKPGIRSISAQIDRDVDSSFGFLYNLLGCKLNIDGSLSYEPSSKKFQA